MRDALNAALSAIDQYTTLKRFERDGDAVARAHLNLIFFFESSTRVSKTTCDSVARIDWQTLYRTRQVYVHEYWNISPETLWTDLTTNKEEWKRGLKQLREHINTLA